MCQILDEISHENCRNKLFGEKRRSVIIDTGERVLVRPSAVGGRPAFPKELPFMVHFILYCRYVLRKKLTPYS